MRGMALGAGHEQTGLVMPQPYQASAVRRADAGRPGRAWILIVLAVLVVTIGTALAFGIGTPEARPREGKAIHPQQPGHEPRAPVVRTIDIIDCEPMETQDVAVAPPR